MTSKHDDFLQTLKEDKLIVLAPFLARRHLSEALERLPRLDPEDARSLFAVYVNNTGAMTEAGARLAALGPDVLPYLLERLPEEGDPVAIQILLEAVLQIGGEEGLSALMEWAGPHLPMLVRAHALRVIVALNRGRADDFLRAVAQNWEAEDKVIALEGLAARDHLHWQELAGELLEHPDREVQKEVIKGLSQEVTRKLSIRLIGVLYSKHYGAAFYAAQKLCKIAPEVADDLFRFPERKGPYFKEMAIKVLARTKQEKQLPRLCAYLLEDGNKAIRAAAAGAIASLKIKSPEGREQALQALRTALEREQAHEVATEAAATVLKLRLTELAGGARASLERLGRSYETETLAALDALAGTA